MQYHFTGHNVSVTPALKQLTEKKLERLKRHFDRITSIKITFTIEHLTQIAEATIHVPGADFHVRAKSDDLYKAIDDMVQRLDRQIVEHKLKQIQNHREPHPPTQ